jgi:dihydrofolate synthase/folylpolyglutamate synthase
MTGNEPAGLITDYAAATAFLDARIGSGVKPGLERIVGLLDLMASPQEAAPVIHVAGTNGKTTTVGMISTLVHSLGLRAGTFVSPHLHHVEERFTISGETLDRESFTTAVADVVPFVDIYETNSGETVTYFEATAAVAFQAFAAAGVDVAIVEVGLGGRLDATNVVNADVSVITGIDIDHTAFLGSTISEIAGEKAGIVKEGGTLVSGPLPPAAEGAITARVENMGATWYRSRADFRVEDASIAVGGWHGDIHGIYENYDDLFLPMHGRHQLDHLATAVAACEVFLGRALGADDVRTAAALMASPGRIEVMSRGPLVVLDGAHNAQGMEGLAEALAAEFPDVPWLLVFGARGERDLAPLLEPLRGLVAEVIATAAADEQAIAPDAIATAVTEVFGADLPVEIVVPVAQAITEAMDRVDDAGAVVIAGSLYVAGEARRRWQS